MWPRVANSRQRRNVLDLIDDTTGKEVENPKIARTHPGARLAHELLGHALSQRWYHYGDSHINSIQVSNLFYRHLHGNSRYYRDGSGHDMGQEIEYDLLFDVPDYLKPFDLNR